MLCLDDLIAADLPPSEFYARLEERYRGHAEEICNRLRLIPRWSGWIKTDHDSLLGELPNLLLYDKPIQLNERFSKFRPAHNWTSWVAVQIPHGRDWRHADFSLEMYFESVDDLMLLKMLL